MNNAFRIIFDIVKGQKPYGHAERNRDNLKTIAIAKREIEAMLGERK